MGWLIALGILIAINLIRIGVEIEYSETAAVRVRIAGINMQVVPARVLSEEELEKKNRKKQKADEKKARKAEKKRLKEEKKRLKENKEQSEPEKEAGQKKGGALDIVLSVLPPVFQALGGFIRRLDVTQLTVYYTAAGDDPFDTVMSYGYVNAGMGALTPFLERMKIRNRDLRTYIDMNISKPLVYIKARIGMALWEYVYIVLRLVVSFVVRYIKRMISKRRKEAERN